MILPRYYQCPICQVQGKSQTFDRINHNSVWWEECCSNRGSCGFHQYFFTSFEDTELSYFQFRTQDFFYYVYSENYGFDYCAGKMYAYFNIFPRGEPVQNPFQIWENYMPNFQELDKLNKKLNLLSLFS